MAWTEDGPQGFESRKIKYLLPRYTRGRVLEIGCGMEKAYPHFIGYDSGHHFGKGAADITGDAADLSMFADESFDAVFSSHVLEHMVDMQAALAEWSRIIRPGGFLCLYVPSANLYPKCGEPGANPDHKHDIYPGDIASLLLSIGKWEQCECEERSQDNEYSLFEVYQKHRRLDFGLEDKKIRFKNGRLIVAKHDSADEVSAPDLGKSRIVMQEEMGKPSLKAPEKTACVVRYGGFGDMLQAASILPGLKKQGFHVTMMTTPKGQEIVKHDPNIDDWYIQDTDQVPNEELYPFWKEQAKRFDRFINLSESIEGTMLGIPGRSNHAWPHDVRHRMLNKNYFDFTADLAGVDFKPCKMFYPTEEEASRCKESVGNSFSILWSLAGSSIHKFTPHQDAVLARIMLEMPDAKVFLVGDEACQLLEQGWENEPRVVKLSGKIGIRETLALAQAVDLVVGPETGVLNSVAHEPNAKVILLSHSSKKNLTQHWYNTSSLTPVDTPCYPCHRLHYSTEFCDVDEQTGTALCMRNISAAAIWQAISDARKGKKK